jgi:hypothetical protein
MGAGATKPSQLPINDHNGLSGVRAQEEDEERR